MIRIGQGWDRHRLVEGRKCILGGVEFPDSPLGLLGHSDGDALCHALCDALLGAAALGDIGVHFPDRDPRWEGADSLDLLARVVEIITTAGWRIINVDSTVIAEQPRIAPRSAQMRQILAGVLGIRPEAVSVKGTRGEGLGPEGRSECITAVAIALLEES